MFVNLAIVEKLNAIDSQRCARPCDTSDARSGKKPKVIAIINKLVDKATKLMAILAVAEILRISYIVLGCRRGCTAEKFGDTCLEVRIVSLQKTYVVN